MTPLPFALGYINRAPMSPGCYLIYAGPEPYYAGASRVSVRARLRAHLLGRGSRMIRRALADGEVMYFEYYDVYPWEGTTIDEVRNLEFVFMTMHAGKLLPGNLRADNFNWPSQPATELKRTAVPIERYNYDPSGSSGFSYFIEVRQTQQVYVIRCHGELVKSVVGDLRDNLSALELYNRACQDIDNLP